MRTLTEGTRLADRYQLVRKLGAGGMSETWLADDARSDARVVLKFLSGDAAEDPRRKSLLQREWRIGSRLMHPNIIRVFEFHDEADGPYFGMQFVGGTDIGVLCGKSPDESMRPAGMIADALRYAHGKDVVHRDIKAANILLDSRGIPYLVDFGVADTAGSEAVAGSGSDVAMSPEQKLGGAARSADDIYALGVLMHELLTGQPPADQGERVVSEHLPNGERMPRALHGLLVDMLANDARSRPDAETVTERLTDAGFPPGPAPAKYGSGQGAIDEVIDTATPATTFRRAPVRPAATETSAAPSGGIPPKVLYGGLGAALVVFLAVIFVLPTLVDDRGRDDDAAPVASEPSSAADDGTTGSAEDDSVTVRPTGDASFSENLSATGGTKVDTDEALGDLLSQLERLRYRAIDRWGGQPYLDAVDVYEEGDQAYVDRNYRLAGERYREASRMLEPFFDRIEGVFEETLSAAKDAFDNGDPSEAVRLFDLAVAITPGNREAEAGLARAQSLSEVLSLMEQGLRFETDLELDAAKLAFEKALELDPLWEPAANALERIRAAITNLSFEQRMTEGFESLGAGDFDTARAAFNAARILNPDSREPADGLLQVDQEVRLADIRRLEQEALSHDGAEEWETSIVIYQDILKIDPDLQFAQEGLTTARSRAALHQRLLGYIENPDGLSDAANMQSATALLLDIARMDLVGPRLEDQKTELNRLLKRAATPLAVQLVSDGVTDVSIYQVGRFGTFSTRELELKPGNYVAVGIRPGYRDVRVEFRVAPEIDMQPIVVRCEEAI